MLAAGCKTYALRVTFPNDKNKRLADWQAVELVGCGGPEARPNQIAIIRFPNAWLLYRATQAHRDEHDTPWRASGWSERLGIECLQIGRSKAGVLGDAREHLGTDLFAIVKREDKIRPTIALQCPMRAGLTLKLPANPDQRRVDTARLGRSPLVHAAATAIEIDSGRLSPCSSLSASTRSARISAFAIASSADDPYARTPGSCGTSASQRPSSSRSHSISNFIAYPA
jgi:hypothetical protein